MSDRKMRLAAYFNPTGHHVASWRHPRAQVDAPVNIDHYVEIARSAVRAISTSCVLLMRLSSGTPASSKTSTEMS